MANSGFFLIPMPRKNPLSAHERAVGARLAEFRRQRLIPQTSLALALGISRGKLNNYETGISPVPWGVGVRLFREFQLSPRWLATGKLPMIVGRGSLPDPSPSQFTARSTLSEVYAKVWREALETETAAAVVFAEPPITGSRERWPELYAAAVEGWLKRVPEGEERDFLLELADQAERILSRGSAAPKKKT